MKKKHIKQTRIPVTVPENCRYYYVSYGFHFLIQAIQLGIGGMAMCVPIALLCPQDRNLIPLLLAVCALAPILCCLVCWIEGMIRKKHEKPLVGINSESIYLSDGPGMIHRLDEIVGIYYRFGQFRKRGKSAYLQVYLKSGKPMNIILPSPSLILALRKAVPSVRIKAEWVVRLVVCLLIGLSVGGLMSLMLLMQ